MQIEYSKQFIKAFRKCPPKVKNAFKKKLKRFIINQYEPSLNNHCLSGKLKNYRSINVTGDFRAIFKIIDNGKFVYFVMIGKHSQLYS